MNPNELEFLAENEVVQIVPRFKMPSLDLLDNFVSISSSYAFLIFFKFRLHVH